MRRPLLVSVLLFITIAGFASGFHDLRRHHADRETFEEHIADVCTKAALRSQSSQPLAPAPANRN
jgi:hypothetical protein